MSATATYRPRHPERTPFYQCLADYWDEFKQSYPYFYEAKYGPRRPVVDKTVDRFLECGLLRHGFARLKCGRCSHRGRPIESDDRPASKTRKLPGFAFAPAGSGHPSLQ